MIKFPIIFILAYLLGSINTSIIVGKIKSGDDIRNHGSGNAGATNALRTYGKSAAIMVLIGDALKAVVAILLAKLILNEHTAVYVAGIGVTLGHNFPLYFGFKGGKGVVVSAISCLFANWFIGVLSIVSAILIMAITKFVSLGSVLGAVLMIVFGVIFKTTDIPFIVFSVLLGGLAIFMHRTNIIRLINGTENKLSFSKKGGE